ncbi:MAG: hypothetical protein AAGG51_14005 [Cyanobacteria bacterium P01_G01_bin.54]
MTETFIIYKIDENDDHPGLVIPGVSGHQSRISTILRESYDFRPPEQCTTEVGERLTQSLDLGGWRRRIVPSEWVVTRVENYAPTGEAEFVTVRIAYCERQPLTAEEQEQLTDEVEVAHPSAVAYEPEMTPTSA